MGLIVVTGAAGFIGSHLTDRLLNLGYEVFGVDSFTEYYSRERKLANLREANSKKGLRFVEGDLLDLDLVELLSQASGVVHLSAEPGVRTSWGIGFSRYLRRNVEATQRLLEAVSEQEIERFVFASSSSVYGSVKDGPVREDAPLRPASPYAISKLAAEEMVGLYHRERGVPATSLRYFTVYGPRQRPEMALSQFISAAALNQTLEVYGDGTQVREMTYIADVVDATVAALEHAPGGTHNTYNVGGGTRATVNELIEAVGRVLETQPKVNYRPAAEGDVRCTWANVDLAALELNFRPQVGLEEGIRAQAEWVVGEIVTYTG